MLDVTASTEIAAAPGTVWKILTELERYPAWNPFIREAHGRLEIGEVVEVRLRPRFLVPLRFRATILQCDEGQELRWRGNVGNNWLASGEHRFVIEPLGDNRVRFIQIERFGGVLPRFVGRLLEREAREGFIAMNRALAQEAERAELAPAQRSRAGSQLRVVP